MSTTRAGVSEMRYATLQDHLGCGKRRAIELAAGLGFDGVEFVVPDGTHDVGPHGMELNRGVDVEADEIWSADGRDRLRRHAADHGIEIASLCPSFLNLRPGLSSADPDERAAVAGTVARLAEAAADLGAGVVLVPFFLDAEIETEGERGRVAEAIAPAAAAAEAAGATLGLETSLPADENRSLVEEIGSPAVGIYYDVGNAAWRGHDPAAELRAIADVLVPRLHLKDGAEGLADAALGEGRVDFDAVADALREVGYDDWLVLETGYREDPVEETAANLRFARGLVD